VGHGRPDRDESAQLAARFKALADPTRVGIVNRLAASDDAASAT
jgi:DNA-binding transcriptional ArsR family regulator